MTDSCDSHQCSCDGQVTGSGQELTVYSKHFELACSSGLTYFSACHAGCQEAGWDPDQSSSLYYGCGCLEAAASPPPPAAGITRESLNVATPGICDAGCTVVPLAVILFFCILFMFMGTMPGLVASLRYSKPYYAISF